MKDKLLMIMIFILQGAFFKMATQCKCLRLHSFRKNYKKICFLNQRSDFVTFYNSKIISYIFGIYYAFIWYIFGIYYAFIWYIFGIYYAFIWYIFFELLWSEKLFTFSLSLSWETKNLHYRFSFQIKQVIFQNLIYFTSGSFFYVDIFKKCI